MKKIPVLLFVLIAVTAGAQEKKPIITVLDLQTNNISQSDMKSIVTFLSAELFETGAYTVIDSGQRDALLSELEFSMSGCTDETCQLEVGKMLAAELIVVGDIGKIGERIVITLKVLNTETSETLNTAKAVYTNITELIDDLGNIAIRISGKQNLAETKDTAEEIGLDKITEEGKSRQKSGKKTTGAVLMGGGVALLAAGTVFVIDAIDRYTRDGGVQDLYDAYYNAPDLYDGTADGNEDLFAAQDALFREYYLADLWDAYNDALSSQKTSGILGVVGLGAGLVTAVTGVVLFFSKSTPAAPEKPAQELSAVVNPFGVRIRISF